MQRLSAASAAQAGAIVYTSWLHHVHVSIYEVILQVRFECCNRVLVFERVIVVIGRFYHKMGWENVPNSDVPLEE